MKTLKTIDRNLPLKWLYLAWFSLIFTVTIFVLLGFVAQGDPGRLLYDIGIDQPMAAFGLTIIGTVLAVSILRHKLRKHGFTWADVGLKGKLTGKSALYAFLGWFVAFWLFYLIQQAAVATGTAMFWNDETNFIDPNSIASILLILTGPVVIASIAEEVIFRGYVLNALRAKFKLPTAATLAALVFASVHIFFGPGFLIYIFLGSFIPIYLYLKFDSLYPAMLMHFINNLVSYIVIPILLF